MIYPHCVGVGIAADRIASALLEKNKITQEECDTVIQRGIIHDANKPLEIMRTGVMGQEAFSQTAYDMELKLLNEKGASVPKPILDYLQIAGKETGHNSLSMFLSLDTTGEVIIRDDASLADCIVHIADDATSSPGKSTDSTQFVEVKKRMRLRKFPKLYSFMYKEGFGFDTDGKPVIVKDVAHAEPSLRNVRSYGEWQPIVNRFICKKIQTLIDTSSQEDPEDFVENLINQGLTKSKRNKEVVRSFKQDKSAKT